MTSPSTLADCNSDLLQVLVPLGGFGCLHWFEQCLPLGICEEACGVVYYSHMGRTFQIHTDLYDVHLSYKHDIAYDVSQYPSGFADLCFLFCFVCVFVFVLFFCLSKIDKKVTTAGLRVQNFLPSVH